MVEVVVETLPISIWVSEEVKVVGASIMIMRADLIDLVTGLVPDAKATLYCVCPAGGVKALERYKVKAEVLAGTEIVASFVPPTVRCNASSKVTLASVFFAITSK